MRKQLLTVAMGFIFLAGCCCCCGDSSGPSTPASPEEKAFGEANRLISSHDSDDGAGFGNTPQAKAVAVEFARRAAEMEPEWFSGGDEGRLSLSDGNFLTYCRMNTDSVCFLVHVPQLKNYEDEVRDGLIEMLWICAEDVLDGKVDPGTEVSIGLRGAVLYGGLAIGKLGNDPAETENSSIVDKDKLFRFFKDEPVKQMMDSTGPPDTKEEPETDPEGDPTTPDDSTDTPDEPTDELDTPDVTPDGVEGEDEGGDQEGSPN